MNILKVVSITLIFAFVTGCKSTTPLQDPKTVTSVVDYTKKLQTDTSYALDKVIGSITGNTSNYQDYIVHKDWWCPKHEKASSANGIKMLYKKVCEARNGTYVNGGLCKNSKNPDEVFFFAQVTTSYKCTNAETANVTIIEPTNGTNKKNYLLALNKVGFLTQKQEEEKRVQAEKHAAEIKAKRKLAMENKRYLMKEVGTKVCKWDNSKRSKIGVYGYIEKVAKLKIQISVNNQLHWIQPENDWFVCE